MANGEMFGQHRQANAGDNGVGLRMQRAIGLHQRLHSSVHDVHGIALRRFRDREKLTPHIEPARFQPRVHLVKSDGRAEGYLFFRFESRQDRGIPFLPFRLVKTHFSIE